MAAKMKMEEGGGKNSENTVNDKMEPEATASYPEVKSLLDSFLKNVKDPERIQDEFESRVKKLGVEKFAAFWRGIVDTELSGIKKKFILNMVDKWV